MDFAPKYKALIKHKGRFDILEGSTYSGKTTVGAGVKFMLEVAQSNKKFHGIAGNDLGVVEKNIINAEKGILAEWGDYVDYRGSGTTDIKMAHLVFRLDSGEQKIIYVFGYEDKARWKKALGGQLGCLYVDEANIASIDFIQEASIRCDYMLWTLNPDNPDLQIYSEYINHARPLKKYESIYPPELLNQLNLEPKEGYTHWYFNFDDNVACTPEKRKQIMDNAPVGSKIYKNKILGLRGRATGLVFNLQEDNILSSIELHDKIRSGKVTFSKFSCGVDTSYSQKTKDTFSFIFKGISSERKSYILDEMVINNRDRVEKGERPLAPSDIPPLLFIFLEKNREEWGFARTVFIDSADSATITECNKYKRQKGCIYSFAPAWKKTKIIDRINLVAGWLGQGYYHILSHCKNTIKEFNTYSWREDKDEPEDGNDHCINADQYSWLPFKGAIGDYNNGMV